MAKAVKTLLVTGAAGTIGNYVVSLAESAGWRVIATDRITAGLRSPMSGVVRVGDITSGAFIDEVLKGCDAVIHTAAQLRPDAGSDELAKVNTDAVVSLFEAAHRHRVSRFIHLSTAMLYAVGQPGPLNETATLGPRGPFGLSKHGAEVFLRGQDAGPAWTILRAAPVYGQRGRHFAASLLSVGPVLGLATPVLSEFVGGPEGTMVHAEDVARAAVFCLEHPETERRVFNVAESQAMSLGDRITHTLYAYGLRVSPKLKVTAKTFSTLGRICEHESAYRAADLAVLAAWRTLVARHGLKPALRPRLDREAMTLLYDPLVVDTSALQSLGWSPRFPSFVEGWANVLRWYQAEGWVPRYRT